MNFSILPTFLLSFFLVQSSNGERMSPTNAMNSSPGNPIPMREEEEVNRFRESLEIFDKFFKWLFGVIAFKTTAVGEALFITNPNVMMIMVLMIVLYFFVWLLGTMLPQRSGILVCIILLIGSVSSVLILTIISSHIAWLTIPLWFGVFAVAAYYYSQELYKWVVRAILDTTKKLIEDHRRHSTRLPV